MGLRAKPHLWIIAAVTFQLSLLIPSTSRAGIISCLVNIARDIKGYWPNPNLIDVQTTNKQVLQLGTEINSGSFGRVNAIESLPHEMIPPGLDSSQLVIKMPLWKPEGYEEKPFTLADSVSAIRKEYSAYLTFQNRMSQIEQNSRYPQKPAWKSGHLPVAPSYQLLETDAGPSILKLRIHGKTHGEILRDYKGVVRDRDPAMVRSLKEIYQLVQTLYQETGVSVDALPHNLVWVSDAQQMQQLGLERPSFVFYELSQYPKNKAKFIQGKLSLDSEGFHRMTEDRFVDLYFDSN